MMEHFDKRNSLVRVVFEELLNEILILLTQFRFERHRVALLIFGNHSLITSERRITMDELVEEDA